MVKLTLTLHQTTKMEKIAALNKSRAGRLNSFCKSNRTFAHFQNGKEHYVAKGLFAHTLVLRQAVSGTCLANNTFPKASETRALVGGEVHGFPSHRFSPGNRLTSLSVYSVSTVLLDPYSGATPVLGERRAPPGTARSGPGQATRCARLLAASA